MRQTASLAPDVVLMDLQMPGTDGTTATAAIRAAHPEVRVLALTTRHGANCDCSSSTAVDRDHVCGGHLPVACVRG
ncbi:LuxR family two component transcriptional regulator [Streptomyces bottropensis ATCC 25435]|uniref:LuxR family two component transcriptional regulator n=2 Tax=Streptomyces bottropensis TaxID=42235 RepID=M3DHY2_9ACTN|nr:LuxR family two component transcriptional regulator [Streptomyces bottropensis ATCC 25435]